ncbi:LPD23 domain-containing protein [Mailhella sp.]
MSQSLIEQFRQEDAANGYTPGQNVRPALEMASATSADRQARSMQLAEELGMPRGVVAEQSEWAEQEAKARRIERNPLFARWAELDETNAAFARDDTEKTGDLFEILANGGDKDVVRAMLRYNAKRGDKAAQARLQSEFGMSEDEAKGIVPKGTMPGRDTMDWGLLEAHMPRVIEPIQDALGGFVQAGNSFMEGSLNVAKSAAGFMALLGENMDKVVLTIGGEDAKPMWQALAKNAREAEEYIANLNSDPLNAQGYVNDFVRNLPQVLAAIPVAYFGGPVAGTAFMGTQIAGGTYADLTQKHEVRMPTAAELEEGARLLASAAAQGWQGAVNNARIAAHEAGGEGGELYQGAEPDENALASARARMIAAAILNTTQATPAGAAALLSLGNAAVQAPLEMIGFGKMFDVFKSTGAGNLVRRIVESAATEFVTETIQQHPDEFARIWGEGTASGESFQDVWQKYTGQFWDITKEGMYAGALSAPFGILGGIGKAATDVRMAHEAVDWCKAHIAFHAKVEETKAKQAAPALVQGLLEEGGMRDIAHVDGEALYQLAQEDPLVLQQLGLEEKAVQQAAEAGQTISLPMSRVHAQMQQAQLNKFMAVSRREPDSWTAQEAEVLPETLKQTAERAAEEVASKTEAARLAEIEIRRMREEAVQAVSSVPTLMAKLQSEGTSPEAYVDNNLEIIVRQAKYLAEESGGSIADVLRDYTFEGLDYDPSGKLVPVSRLRDAERLEEERARAEADRPFWELVWGRVDPESLKTDYAETYKQLRKEKRGLFMPAGRGGVPLDQIADELNERGIFTGSADDLLELLKTKERPRRGYYQEGELTAEENFADGMEAMERVIAEKADIVDAMYRAEVGGITFYWGEEGKGRKLKGGSGVAHIIARRNSEGQDGEAVARKLVEVLAYGEIGPEYGPEGGQHRNVTHDGHTAVLSLYRYGNRETWLLTGWKDHSADGAATVNDTEPTQTIPSGIREKLGAAENLEKSITQGGEEVNSLQQTGWHGAGVDFDAFDFSYMGTGEGHQVHGWGGYVAASKEISDRRYRERFAKGVKIMANGERIDEDTQKMLEAIISGSVLFEAMESGDFTKFRKSVRWYIDHYRRPDRYRTELIKMLQEQIDRIDANPKMSIKAFLEGVPSSDTYRFKSIVDTARSLAKQEGRRAGIADVRDRVLAHMEPFAREARQDLENADKLEALDIDNLEVHQNKGQLFELEIPEEEEMLIEGKAFSEQLPAIQEAILKAFGIGEGKTLDALVQEIDHQLSEIRDKERAATNTWEKAHLAARYDELRRVQYNIETIYELIGKDIYKTLALYLGSPKAASLALLREGVQGISYKGGIDGQAWVIFDEQKMQVVNKLYQFIGEEGAARLDEADEASTRLDNLDVARQMEEAGKDAAAIKMATGWERGADGKWRYEIDDSYSSMNILYPDMQGPLASTLLSDQQADELAEKLEIARRVQANPDATMAELFGEDGPKVQRMLFDLGNLDQFVQQTEALLEGGDLTLGAILDHEELFTAYPRLRDVQVNIIDDGQRSHGSYSRSANLITLNKAALDDAPLLMHEVQHAIQDREGFSRGGSPEAFKVNEEGLVDIGRQQMENRLAEASAIFDAAPPKLQEKMRALNRAQINKDFDLMDELEAALSEEEYKVWSEYDWLMGEARTLKAEGNQVTPREAYRSLRGEQEAYNTQRRMGMTYEERLASLASSTEDVARKDQIFLRDALGRAMAMGEGRTKGVTRGETVRAEYSGGMGDVIRLFYHADLSTLTHESAHVFFLQMKRLVDSGKASERMKADYQTLCEWAGSTDGFLDTPQHERLARGMELYLREGKAPSKRLESAFARFRRWLLDIYKTVAGNPYFVVDGKPVELNPEVRRVFSRILATQEEVEAQAAEDAMGGDWITRLDKLGVTGAQRITIAGLIQDARNHAETELYRQREADKMERMAQWRKECAKQIESERVYQARRALRARKGYGLDMGALAAVVGNERAAEFFRRLPGIKREGASPWAFAAQFDYDSVEEFVNEVMAAPTKSERMAELMAAKEQEYDRQFRSESLLEAEQTAKALEMIHEHLIKVTGSTERGVPLKELKRAASDLLAALPIEEAISAGKFRYQAKRLMQAQHEAFMRGDFGRALDITFKLRLNLELTVQAQQRKKEFDTLTRDLARFTASKEPNPVVRYGVARLAMKHGMLAPTKMILRTEGDKDLNAVQDWFKAAQMQGYSVEYDAEVWNAQLPTWRQMNSETFRRVYAQLKSMMTVEQKMRHVEVQGKRMALDQYSQQLGQHILDNDPNRQNLGFSDDKSLVQATKEFLEPLATVNARLKMFDAFKPLGLAWRSIMEPINRAEARQIAFFREYGPMLQALIKKYYDNKRLVTMKDRKQIPGLKEAVSHEMCIMVGLNVGNAGNRLRLTSGFKNTKTMQDYGDAEVYAMLEQLDENDWRFIQEVWDFFEQFKKESFDMEERLTGVRPLEVEAAPVRTKYGTLRGGYFPIAYDPRRGAKAANQQIGGIKNVMMPSVYHGMMKDRGDQGLGTPLDLRFSVITDKLAETGHNLAYREPVIEVAKLLRSHAVSRVIAATEGPTVELKFWKWLSDLTGEKPAQNSMDKLASWATSRMAIYAMGFKVTTMFAQATGLLATSTQLGWKWTMRGVRDTFNGGNLERAKEMWQDICARSPMMQDRLKSFDRDVYAMSKRLFETGHKNQVLNLMKKTESWLTEHAFTMTGFIQLWMVDIPTWRGAFAKGMEELNMTEEEAALYADDMVVTAQGSGSTKDLADIMREKGFMRIMTMFYSYFSAMYNMFLMQTSKTFRHPKEEWPYLASMAFVLWFIEPAVTNLITGRGPDDDEELHEWFLWNGVKQPFQMIPVLRDLSGAYFDHIDGKFGSDYRFTPAADVIGAFEKALEHGEGLFTSDSYEGRKKAVKRLARDVGMISGTPFLSSQAITTIGNMWDWLDGTEEFALRDLLFTRKK